tara:strand:+ start:2310 stop:2486 length:177 start_codon:yes stop_codon:yes gene_type:complete
MNITVAQNHNSPTTGEITSIKATIDGVEMFVPLDPANRHYAEILRQVAAGELTIADAD